MDTDTPTYEAVLSKKFTLESDQAHLLPVHIKYRKHWDMLKDTTGMQYAKFRMLQILKHKGWQFLQQIMVVGWG